MTHNNPIEEHRISRRDLGMFRRAEVRRRRNISHITGTGRRDRDRIGQRDWTGLAIFLGVLLAAWTVAA